MPGDWVCGLFLMHLFTIKFSIETAPGVVPVSTSKPSQDRTGTGTFLGLVNRGTIIISNRIVRKKFKNLDPLRSAYGRYSGEKTEVILPIIADGIEVFCRWFLSYKNVLNLAPLRHHPV